MASEPLHLHNLPGSMPRVSPRAPEMRIVARNWRSMFDPHELARWEALAQWAAEPNPFLESWFLLPALENLDPQGRVQLLCLDAGGQLAGLIPVSQEARYYGHPLPQLSGWHHGNSFLGAPLVARGLEAPFWRALLAWADENAGQALFLHLARMPLDGALYDALRTVLREQTRPAALVHREERALLCSDMRPEAYLEAALTGKKRKELRRQHSRLSELGNLRFERRRDDQGIDEWTENFLRLEASGWKGSSGHAMARSDATATLFREALAGAAPRGRLERLAFILDGQPIAMLANFLTPPGAFSFKTAFDERYSRFSPGVLLQRENLALLDLPEVEWCDSCASADHPMIDHFWRERRAIGRINIGIGGVFRRMLFRAIAFAETRKFTGELA